MVIKRYANILKADKESPNIVDKPPSYFECLIGMGQPVATEVAKCEKMDAVYTVEEVKKETEVPKETL